MTLPAPATLAPEPISKTTADTLADLIAAVLQIQDQAASIGRRHHAVILDQAVTLTLYEQRLTPEVRVLNLSVQTEK